MQNQSRASHKQNRAPIERRLSLKYSSAVSMKQQNPRLSIPMRRDSIATASGFSTGFTGLSTGFTGLSTGFTGLSTFKQNHRQSIASISNSTSSIFCKQTKKQAILTNLIKKLDHQQQLKQIINSKIKNTKQCTCSQDSQNTELLTVKLRNCQQEIECFKNLVRELVNKINLLQKNESDSLKMKGIEIGIQTQSIGCVMDTSMDFIENLDKTLKVLNGVKGRN